MNDNYLKEIKKKTINSVKWKIANAGLTAIINPLFIVILASLLTPKEYGLIAVITMIISFSQKFVDMGFSHSIIQRKKVSDKDLSSIFWFVTILGLIMSLFTSLIAPLLAEFYNDSSLIKLINYSAIVFLLHALSTVYISILKKELMYNVLTKVMLAQLLIQKAAILLLAYFGFGAISFVFGTIIGIVFTNLQLIYVFRKNKIWRPKLIFSFNSLKEYFKFGISIVGQSLLNNVFYYLDEFLITTLFGIETLGIYYFVKNIFTSIIRVIDTTFSQILFPVLSKITEFKSQFNNTTIKIVKLVSSIIIPAMIGLSITSKLFVPLLFDIKWVDSIPFFYYLSIWAIFYMLTSVMLGPIYAIGRSDWVFVFSVIELPIRTIILYLSGLYGGIIVFIGTLGLLQLVKYIGYQVLLARNTDISPRSLWYCKVFIIVAALAANLSGVILQNVLIFLSWSKLFVLILTITFVMIFYLLLLYFTDKKYVKSIILMIKSALKRQSIQK